MPSRNVGPTFKNSRDVLGFVGGHQAANHVAEDINRLGREAGTCSHGRGSRPRAGVVRAEDEAEGIDEEEFRHFLPLWGEHGFPGGLIVADGDAVAATHEGKLEQPRVGLAFSSSSESKIRRYFSPASE